jgi:hypothetical protein
MKIFFVHNKAGSIRYLGIPSENLAVRTGLNVGKGLKVSEIKVSGIRGSLALPRNQKYLASLIKDHTIKITGKKPSLVRRSR